MSTVPTLQGLTKIIDRNKLDIAEWKTRNDRVDKAPYPADSVCYYCPAQHSEDYEMCVYCIHNADNKLLEIIK